MHKIFFYDDKNGKSPVLEFVQALSTRKDKDSRINYNKLIDYIEALKRYGVTLGEPHIKHLEGDIWELRPIRNRVLFASWNGNDFILLHQFIKKTQKTPQREIDQAKRNLKDKQERGDQ